MRLIASLIGAIIFLLGVILAFMPIPFGLILMAVGLFIMLSSSLSVRHLVKWLRRRNARIDRWLDMAAAKLPQRYADVLNRTRPDCPDEETDADLMPAERRTGSAAERPPPQDRQKAAPAMLTRAPTYPRDLPSPPPPARRPPQRLS